MGVYQSSFEKTDAQAKIHFNPSKADWITGHADLTGWPLLKLNAYGIDFDKWEQIKTVSYFKKHLKKILSNLPKERDGSLSFIVYLRLMQWTENSDIDSKLKVIFNFLNNGKELDMGTAAKLFSRVYPNISNDELRDVTDLFMSQMDDRKTGRISENQFVYTVKRIASPSQLKELLTFDIIPPMLLDEVNMQPSIGGSMISLRNSREDGNARDRITDEQLELITSKIIKKKWEQLLLKLGYLEYDIETCKAQNRGNLNSVVLELLKQWRDQDPFMSTSSRLKRYLEECGMIDAALVLETN